ncbi:PLP-dependent aminotransferase family protein [Paenibacillus sp. HWE-109]|uniref:MocR-like pyridoxine biosynthesis transcription factor PdxR n=1 Tax=Paenibacillus sp. HWE-109 TaxID=1306526 RepID=UPI001EDD7653|nr:PLP-dependent aminotransferase family protein [Paenibacillus sp. HWE-109]UKS27945.1 PLP-dependent aminotransferase family protein [Paenibacillus sp. HWE-109]
MSFIPESFKTKQIYSLLRERILQGIDTAGTRLPSTRDLAKELGVSRSLIVEVYEQLISEGYLEGRQGSGTYVTDLGKGGQFLCTLLNRTDEISTNRSNTNSYRFDGVDFRPSLPALEFVPRQNWKKSALYVYDNIHLLDFGYDDPAGNLDLRNHICSLLHTKGINCLPTQVIITTGATQAISILCKLFLTSGDELVTEDPTGSFIYDIFASSGARIIPVPVDRFGLRIKDIPSHAKPKFIFVTPSHQFPFGSIMSIERRIQLLEYARQASCYVIEDDYDSDFRYNGMPVRALTELDSERVIYLGTFSKNLFPALRLGYMVVPWELVEPLIHLKHMTDFHCPTMPQIILARFMAERYLERHIYRMKRIYGKRRNRMIANLMQAFGSNVQISGDAAGLHLVADFPGYQFDTRLIALLEERKIRIYPAERFTIVKGRYEDRLIMGFGNVTEQQISNGIATLSTMLVENGKAY